MIGSNNPVQVYLATAPVDLRKSFDSLAEHVRTFLGHDPLCGSLFVFRNRNAQRLKILWWDANGLAIYYKRLEKGTFCLPCSDQKTLAVCRADLLKLLSGCRVEFSR